MNTAIQKDYFHTDYLGKKKTLPFRSKSKSMLRYLGEQAIRHGNDSRKLTLAELRRMNKRSYPASQPFDVQSYLFPFEQI